MTLLFMLTVKMLRLSADHLDNWTSSAKKALVVIEWYVKCIRHNYVKSLPPVLVFARLADMFMIFTALFIVSFVNVRVWDTHCV